MKYQDQIVSAMLRVYPTAWRQEYGAELADVLSQRPLTAGTVADVLWNGAGQRLRYTEPAARMGTLVMLCVIAGVISNVVAPASAGQGFAAVLKDSGKTLPTVLVTPLATDLYVLMLVGCGCWTHLRYGGPVSESSMAAVRLGALAGMPVMVVGLLMLLGTIHLRVVGPGDVLTLSRQGWTYTYYTARSHTPSSLSVLTAPLFRLPGAWLWGLIGGQLGRVVVRGQHTRPVSS